MVNHLDGVRNLHHCEMPILWAALCNPDQFQAVDSAAHYNGSIATGIANSIHLELGKQFP
jgi:hypothetical protein